VTARGAGGGAATNGAATTPSGAALIINTAPDEFIVAAEGVTVNFLPNSKGPQQVSMVSVEEGTFNNGVWVPGRRLNGDETNSNDHSSFAEARRRCRR